MTALLSRLRHRVGMAIYVGVGALVLGLPIAVELNSGGDEWRPDGASSSAEIGAIVHRTTRLFGRSPVSLEVGYLRAPKEPKSAPDALLSSLSLEDGIIRVELDADAALAAEPPGAGAVDELLRQLSTLKLNELLLRRSTIKFASGDQLKASITEVDADLSISRKGSHTARGIATFGEQRFKFIATWNAGPERKQGSPVPITLKLHNAGFEAAIEGRIDTAGPVRFEGNAQITVKKLKALAGMLGLAGPSGLPITGMQIDGPFDWRDGKLVFPRAVMKVDDSSATGTLALKTGGARPAVEGTLAFELFDVGRYLLPLTPPQPLGSLPKMATAVRDTDAQPVRRSLLNAIDADFRVSIRKVQIPMMETGRAAISLTLKDGVMLADLAELEVENGTASGQIHATADGDRPMTSIRLKLSAVDPGRPFANVIARNPLMGRVNGNAEFVGQGWTLLEFLTTMSGKGTISAVPGARLGLDLPALIYSARRAGPVGWSAAGKGSTGLDRLDVRFLASNGALTIESLQARSATVNYAGAGRFDVPGQLMDFSLAAGAPAGVDKPLIPAEALRFTGSWANPSISYRPVPEGSGSGSPPSVATGNK